MEAETVDSQLLSPGSRVIDKDDPDPNPAVVVFLPDETAEDWDVPGRGTVASDPTNEGYADDAPIATVVFEDAIDEHGLYDDEGPLNPAELAKDGVNHYTFPVPRLALINGEGEDVEPEPAVPEDLLAIAERLEDGGMDVEIDAGTGVVRGEKLGEKYTVTDDGEVEGGALAGRVEEAVGEVLGDG